jgi:hypothetical protein
MYQVSNTATNVKPKLEKLSTEQVMKHPDGSPRGFFKGEHLTLRPVLKEDLGALSALLSEDPLPRIRGPWTLARLEKAFSDEKEPGLWKEQTRYFVAVDAAGKVCGYVWERNDHTGSIHYVQHWVAQGMPDRQAAGAELVRQHTKWLTDWYAAQVIDTRVLAGEIGAEQAQWLAEAGFVPDTLVPGHIWHDGGMRDLQHYVWLSAARKSDSPWSTGEPAASEAVEAIVDW